MNRRDPNDRKKAVGAEAATAGAVDDYVLMDNYLFGTEHSAQFIWSLHRSRLFYEDLLTELLR